MECVKLTDPVGVPGRRLRRDLRRLADAPKGASSAAPRCI